MVLIPWEGGGGSWSSQRGYCIVGIKPPYSTLEAAIVNKCFKNPIQPPTVIYVPFDPETGQFYVEPRYEAPWPYKVYDDRKVFYSPFLHEVMLKYYAKQEGNTLYVDRVPVLVVDYSAVLEAQYYGTERPPDRPIDWQLADWKQGYMLSRMKPLCQNPVTVEYVDPCATRSPQFGCLPSRKTATVYFAEGWWWVKFNASLLELPAEILTTTENVFTFRYKAPKGWKVPLLSQISEYFTKRRVKERATELMQLVGWKVEKIDVERTSDTEYVVRVYTRKIGEMAIQFLPLVALAIIATMFIVGAVVLYKVEAEKTERLKITISATKDLGNEYESCVDKCSSLPTDKERETCLAGCQKIYADTINTVVETSKESTISELTDLMKWAVIGVVVINVIPALTRGGKE